MFVIFLGSLQNCVKNYYLRLLLTYIFKDAIDKLNIKQEIEHFKVF